MVVFGSGKKKQQTIIDEGVTSSGDDRRRPERIRLLLLSEGNDTTSTLTTVPHMFVDNKSPVGVPSIMKWFCAVKWEEKDKMESSRLSEGEGEVLHSIVIRGGFALIKCQVAGVVGGGLECVGLQPPQPRVPQKPPPKIIDSCCGNR